MADAHPIPPITVPRGRLVLGIYSFEPTRSYISNVHSWIEVRTNLEDAVSYLMKYRNFFGHRNDRYIAVLDEASCEMLKVPNVLAVFNAGTEEYWIAEADTIPERFLVPLI